MPKSNILFFTSFSSRSIQIESIALYFKKKDYNVFFLTTCEKGAIHEKLEKNDVQIITRKPLRGGVIQYLIWARFLIKFCRQNNIHFVHSHLQIPNFISSIACRFIKSKVFNVRHNSDVILLNGNKKEKIMEKMISRLSKHIIAISDKVKEQLVDVEHVKQNKIYRINNGYNFSQYQELSLSENEYIQIKNNYKAQHLIVSPGRLIETKRHEIAINGVKQLVEKGINVKLIILGEGPLESKLHELIKQAQLQNSVFLLGYQPNISDYIKAADSVVMLSQSEASSNTIKEAGYYKKSVIVCENVGDFNNYVSDNINGLVISKNSPLMPFILSIEELINNPLMQKTLGENLHHKIMSEFDINLVGAQYEELQNSLV